LPVSSALADGAIGYSPPSPVQFEIAHEFDIPRDALELAVISPDLASKFATTVRKLRIGVRSVAERTRSFKGGVLERTWHYEASVRLPKFAQGYVTPEMTAWDEQSVYETGSHRGRWTIVPNIKPEWRQYFAASGTYALEALGDGRSRRVVEGVLELRVRVVRQVAERLIVGEVRKAFEAEAATLRDMATLV
jgi:hypothetical protein